jgi:uncharacterized protein
VRFGINTYLAQSSILSLLNATFAYAKTENQVTMSLLKKALIITGVTLAFSIIGLFIISGLQSVFAQSANDYANFMKGILVIGHLFTFVFSALLLANIFGRTNFVKYAPLILSIRSDLFIKLLVLMLLTYPIAGLSGALMNQLDWPSWITDLDDKNMGLLKQLMAMDHFYDFIINLFVVAILPGIGEEMLFRGVLQNELQKSLTNRYLPLILSAFIFAAFHLEPTGLITKFLIGCVLGYAYYITKNIFYPMLIHALNNGMQIGIIYFTHAMDDIDIKMPPPDLMQWVISLVSLPFIYHLLKHINQEYLWMRS